MTDICPHPIKIDVITEYLLHESEPEEAEFVFRYTITITNESNHTVKLLSRHWVITDGENQVEHVQGDGVIGQQPTIAPGTSYTYSSGCILPTPVGSMYGSYQMQAEDGQLFDAPISPFTLAVPNTVH